jgi:hypothetical protein
VKEIYNDGMDPFPRMTPSDAAQAVAYRNEKLPIPSNAPSLIKEV